MKWAIKVQTCEARKHRGATATALLLVAIAWRTAVLNAPALPENAQVETLLRETVEDQHRSPGIVIGLLDQHGRRVLSCGVTGRPDGRKLAGDTVFEIGSVTKTFTALLLALAVERGELSLDDPAQKFLPDSVKLPRRGERQLTLLDLATQTSGLPRLPSNMKPKDPLNPYSDYTVEQLYAFLSHYSLTRDIGAKYEYSNLGVGLLGHLLALHARTNYEALLVRDICAPLNLDGTRITLTPELESRLAPGHNWIGLEVKNWDIPTLAGAGAIRSTADDLLKYLAAHMGLDNSPLAAAMALTQKVRHSADSPEMSIGLAWHIRKKFGSEITWHNGGTGGYHSFIGFDKNKREGVVVLANTGNPIDDLGWHLLNPEFKLSKPK